MPLAANRLIRGVVPGSMIGADELGRYLTDHQRTVLVDRLTSDVEARAAALVADARATAAAIIGEANAQAGVIRDRAHAEGYQAGYAAGQDAALAENEPFAALLRQAADAAAAVRAALFAGVEEQAVTFALTAARRIVGAAADEYAGLAAAVVHAGIRAASSKVVRVRVHPSDEALVSAMLLAAGRDTPVREDQSVEIGGCILDVEGGTVDLRLGVQLDAIDRAVLPMTGDVAA